MFVPFFAVFDRTFEVEKGRTIQNGELFAFAKRPFLFSIANPLLIVNPFSIKRIDC